MVTEKKYNLKHCEEIAFTLRKGTAAKQKKIKGIDVAWGINTP